MRLRRWTCLSALIAALVVASGAWAAKPAVERFILDDPEDFDAGELCGFPTLIEPNVRITLTDFSDGRTMIHVQGTNQVTNTLSEESVSLHVAGSGVDTELPNGDLRATSRGRALLFYFSGDVGGPGLFLSKGRVVDIFDAATGEITSTRIRGQRTDICALLS
jgi:hypothetical protein